jgi:osmotically-inducible protein OsmY
MRAFLLLALLLGLIGGACWYYTVGWQKEEVKKAAENLAAGAEQLTETIHDKLGKFSLRVGDIKEELDRTGKVARQKAKELGQAIADATADTRITGAIKAKFVIDPDLSALLISVNTTDGLVTLSGSVSSYDSIGKAMLLALETEGVREVISTLQVRLTK